MCVCVFVCVYFFLIKHFVFSLFLWLYSYVKIFQQSNFFMHSQKEHYKDIETNTQKKTERLNSTRSQEHVCGTDLS